VGDGAVILRIEMVKEPGVRTRTDSFDLIDCLLILGHYEGIHEPNVRTQLWSHYELEDAAS
jgi:hypothetical protein